MKKILKIILWTLGIFILIQLIPIDKTNKPIDTKENFTDLISTPPDVEQLLRNSCFDCHSNETIYPKYAYVAPISWSIKYNVNKARKHLNFSEWGSYNSYLKKGILENTIADIEQNRMPHQGYIAQHPQAKLSENEKKKLINFFSILLEKEKEMLMTNALE